MTGLSQMPEDRQRHWLSAPLHTFAVPVTPKSLRETLCRAQSGLHALERERPGTVPASTHEIVALLLDECDRKRPTGSNGKHGDLHTSECGCDR